VIEDDSRLDTGNAACGIDLEDVGHVLREIQDDRDVAALSGERGSSTSAKKRGAEFATKTDCGENIVRVAREHYANRDLAIVGAVSRIESAALVVEAHVAAKVLSQGLGQPQGIGEGRLWGWCNVFECVVHGPVEWNDYFFATVLI